MTRTATLATTSALALVFAVAAAAQGVGSAPAASPLSASSGPPPAAAPASSPAAATAAPGAPAAPAPAAAPVPSSMSDQEYDVRMRELEDMVSELKEQIFRSKAKLQLLAEQVAGGVGTGAKIVIAHKNELGDNFLLTQVGYFLDGQPLWQESDESGVNLTQKREVPVWDGNIVEGSHTLTVNLVYKGNGTGVFRYLSAYSWKLKDSVTFSAEAGKVVTITTVGFEKGNFLTPIEERPAIRFDSNVNRDPLSADAGRGKAP